MKTMNLVKKAAAVVLSAAVAVGSLSLANIVTEGADVTLGEGTQTGNYISMPITIRDFAADGMLFEPNGGNDASGTVDIEAPNTTLPKPKVKFRPSNTSDISTTFFTKSSKTGSGGYIRFTNNNESTTNAVMTFYVDTKNYTRSDARYLVIKYRTSAAKQSGYTPIIYHRSYSENYGSVNFPTTGYNKTSWTTVLIDLKGSGYTAGDDLRYISFYPRLGYKDYIDIAFAAFFSKKADAQTYLDYYTNRTDYDAQAVYNTYNIGNNAGFGLVHTNASSFVNNMTLNSAAEPWTTTGTIQGSTFFNNNGANGQLLELNSGISQTVYGGMLRTDLVEGELGEDKQLSYTEGTVKYLAEMLEDTLPVAWEKNTFTYNLWHVMGINLFNANNEYVGPGASTATKDMADVLRDQITGGLGTYDDAKAKNPKSYADVTTYYDAAYFLLHNTFTDSTGYGKTVGEYNSLRLVEKKKEDGTVFYTFNSAYNDTVYDHVNGVIYNSQTTTANARSNADGSVMYNRGNMVPENSFNPIATLGYGISTNPYYEYLQHISGSTYASDLTKYYANVNFNFSLEGHAQFVYYEDDDLYFTFTGDDDVYLFINGKRVMDLGGGHAISKATVSLNDIKSQLGLVDGNVYDFDFYYMERGGGAGNFGIETNMKIVEPGMVTNMLGFQNGVTTGYNGFVDPSKSVGYGYELTNSGAEAITNLTFTNSTIGVTLTKDAITLNSRSNINEMYAIIYDAAGSIRAQYNPGQLTVDILKQLLAEGIDAGEKIGVYGVKYDITTDDWSASGDTFTNTVNTTAESRDSVTLTGYSEWKVQKQNYSYDCFNVYTSIEQETKNSVSVTKAELLAPITAAGQTVSASSVSIVLCSPSGNTDTTALSENAVLNSDGSITYTGQEAGAENIYYKVTGGSWDNVVFHYHAYTYSVNNNAYVLDYGLPVNLNEVGYGFITNDVAWLAENPNGVAAITGISNITANYGSFTYDPLCLIYTPNKFMNGVDSVTVTVQILESGATELTKFTGVTMTQTVQVMPANVVYYEDDFAGLTYLSNNGNQWVPGSGSGMQSVNQNINYGSDPNYATDKGTDSNGSVSSLNVSTTDEVLTFDFTGTGFELVSRTTYGQYAVVDVVVTKTNGEFVTRMPVITESKGGHLYQVPIISITGLERDAYRVTVKAAGSTGNVVRMFYVDGIRIFNPLDNSIAKDYYNPGEYNAQFLEVKALIEQGLAAYADASGSTDVILAAGHTLIEDVNSDGVLKSVADLSQYMTFGPNNELYLDGDAAINTLALFLTPDESVAAENRTIQIGVHRKADSVNGADGYVTLLYGGETCKVYSGTEQYYTIDVSKLTPDANGRYAVFVAAMGSESPGEVLALTTLKIYGYTFSNVETEIISANDNGDLSNVAVVKDINALYNQKIGTEE